MTYSALARRCRPRNFHSLIGQEFCKRALTNALDSGRLHHAYLFTGTRGVGKTTIARLLAKSLNCERGVSSTPCGICGACTSIDEGRFVDLIEVDGASRTKVEDTRELLENVQYLPTKGRYKIYLIDEVHMLSTSSFNAILKTLEEPPSHVKFLLATTDPEKIPVTVLSRCLQFHLNRIPLNQIITHLETITHQEGREINTEALQILARAADGSLRDALSLLDQALVYEQGRLEAVNIRSMLGLSKPSALIALLKTVARGNGVEIFQEVNALAETTPDFSGLLTEFLTIIHQVAITQQVPEALNDEVDERDSILALAKDLSPEEIQLFYQIGLTGQRDLPYAPDPKMGFEMVLLRMMAFRPIEVAPMPILPILPILEKANAEMAAEREAFPRTKTFPKMETTFKTEESLKTEISSKIEESESLKTTISPKIIESLKTETSLNIEPSSNIPSVDWKNIVSELNLTGLVKSLAEHCTLSEWSNSVIHLILDEAQKPLLNKKNELRLQEALNQYCKPSANPISIRISVGKSNTDGIETPAFQTQRLKTEAHQAAIKTIESDPKVKQLVASFDATIEEIILEK